jgi:hypothetical protein
MSGQKYQKERENTRLYLIRKNELPIGNQSIKIFIIFLFMILKKFTLFCPDLKNTF